MRVLSLVYHPDDFESSPVLPKRARRAEGSGSRTVAPQAQKGKGESSQGQHQQDPADPLPSKTARPSRGERKFNKDTEKALRKSTRESSPGGRVSLETAAPEPPSLDTPPSKPIQSLENGMYCS